MKAVSAIALGLTYPRRTKLQRGTFLHFGHPQLETTLWLCDVYKNINSVS